ncbi:MAG: ATP-binding protein [Gammaproteobacteria bacterium]|nr:ATP-binding protein [Gammaproteobacteria bacterium]
MSFDYETARAFAESGDRDVARWFAGRDEECERIEQAVRESSDGRDQTVFRIIQGAPGAGKTSLLTHLRGQASENRIYVPLRHRDLVSTEAVDARIETVLKGRDRAWATGARWALQGAGRAFRAGDVADEAARRMRCHLAENLELVLTLDEGQAVRESAHQVLLDLHATGFGRPCTLLVAGLSHTADVIGSINGISRPSDRAVLNLTALSADECAESTREMLAALCVDAESAVCREAELRIARISHGWPQHLHGAQVALLEQLLGNDGDLGQVDYAKVREESDRRRIDYYEARLQSHPLVRNAEFVARIVQALGDINTPPTYDAVCEVCAVALAGDRVPMSIREEPPGAVALAQAFVTQGVLGKKNRREYAIAVPSMGDWLTSQIGG